MYHRLCVTCKQNIINNMIGWIQITEFGITDKRHAIHCSRGSFSGPPSSPSLFYTGMLGGGWERGYISLARLPQQLLEQHALLSLMSWAYLTCAVFALLFQQRAGSGVTFDSTFLFEARPLFAWVTSRTRLCHIDDRPPKLHFENFNIDYPWP